MGISYGQANMESFKKYVRPERGGGGTLKAYKNVKGMGVEAKRTYAIKNC